MDAYKPQCDLQVGGSNLILDDIQSLQGDRLGPIHVGASGSAQAKLELPHVHLWEDRCAKAPADQDNGQSSQDQIDAENQPPQPHDLLEPLCVALLESGKPSLLLLFARVLVPAQEPYREDGNEGTRQ